MNGRVQILSAIAAIQIVVIGIVWLGQGSTNEAAGAWIELDADALTRLEFSDGENTAIVLRGEDGWALDGLPADENKLSDILDKLAKIEAPWPVGTSTDALERFEVNSDGFQKRVQAFAQDQVVLDLLLGTSPGYQRVHARKAGESEVFSVALSNYELSASTDGWLDKALLSREAMPDSIRLKTADGRTTQLIETDEGWLVDGEAADQESAETYANRFTALRVLGLHTTATSLALKGTIEIGSPVSMTLEIYREPEEGDYVVRDVELDRAFRLATYTAEQLLMTDLSLVADLEPSEPDVEQVRQSDIAVDG